MKKVLIVLAMVCIGVVSFGFTEKEKENEIIMKKIEAITHEKPIATPDVSKYIKNAKEAQEQAKLAKEKLKMLPDDLNDLSSLNNILGEIIATPKIDNYMAKVYVARLNDEKNNLKIIKVMKSLEEQQKISSMTLEIEKLIEILEK